MNLTFQRPKRRNKLKVKNEKPQKKEFRSMFVFARFHKKNWQMRRNLKLLSLILTKNLDQLLLKKKETKLNLLLMQFLELSQFRNKYMRKQQSQFWTQCSKGSMGQYLLMGKRELVRHTQWLEISEMKQIKE